MEATVVKNAGSHFLLSPLPEWAPFPAVLRGRVRLERSGATNPVAVGDRVRYEFDGSAADELHPAGHADQIDSVALAQGGAVIILMVEHAPDHAAM